MQLSLPGSGASDSETQIVDFRLMDRIKPRLTDMAIALGFPRHFIEGLRKEPDPYHLFSQWLEGHNQKNAQTWGDLITALWHAKFLEEAEMLENAIATSKFSHLSTFMY